MTQTQKWQEELRDCIDSAPQVTVSPDAYRATLGLWQVRCENHLGILEYVFSKLFGFPFTNQDFDGLSDRARRGIYSFTSRYQFPQEGKSVAHIVATILTEGNQEDFLNVFYYRLLSRKARMEHKIAEWERDYQWLSEVLEMCVRRNPSLRLQEKEIAVGEGEVH